METGFLLCNVHKITVCSISVARKLFREGSGRMLGEGSAIPLFSELITDTKLRGPGEGGGGRGAYFGRGWGAVWTPKPSPCRCHWFIVMPGKQRGGTDSQETGPEHTFTDVSFLGRRSHFLEHKSGKNTECIDLMRLSPTN